MIIKNLIKILQVLVLLPLLTGCPQADSVKITPKKEVRDELIVEIQDQIKELGATPITESEAKYKGKLNKDKYIIALRKQLSDLRNKELPLFTSNDLEEE